MAWLYPEQWPGWMDHARVGGGVFDDAPHFVQLLTASWLHYANTSGIAHKIPLSPPPTLRVVFHPEALSNPQWSAAFSYAHDWFRPELNGIQLPFEWSAYAEASELPERRNFFFQIDTPQHQHLMCFFYLGEHTIGAMDLGSTNVLSDSRKLSIHRRLGMTRGSDVQTCYQGSPMWDDIPKAMQMDLRYLGWTLRFAESTGSSFVRIEDVPSFGLLEGGECSLESGQSFYIGESFEFYQGLRDGRPVPELRCRLLIVPKGHQPTAPQLQDVELFQSFVSQTTSHVEVRAWIKSPPMQSDVQLHIHNPEHPMEPPHTLTLEGGQFTGAGTLLYHGRFETNTLTSGTMLRCTASGYNRLGLNFSQSHHVDATLRQTLSLQILSSSKTPFLSHAQLEREYEFKVQMLLDSKKQTPDFDLAALTLWIGGTEHTPIQVPLASVSNETLIFRYLPRSVRLQTPLDVIQKNDSLSVWVEQQRSSEHPIAEHQSWINSKKNNPQHPLATYRLVEFDHACQWIASGESVHYAQEHELLVEGHTLQWIRDIRGFGDPTSTEIFDLLLVESQTGQRRFTCTQYDGHSFEAYAHHETQESLTSHTSYKALWLSCSATDHNIQHPQDRNPEGGPVLAFGLGFGQTNEFAQIRPSSEGFTLHRHRSHIPVQMDGYELPVEPYTRTQGTALSTQRTYGWIRVGSALLRYAVSTVSQGYQLDLALVGYLIRRESTASRFVVTCGTPQTSTQLAPNVFRVRLPGEKRSGELHFSLPTQPPAGQRPTLLLQVHNKEALPEPLQYGKRYTYGSLELSIWDATLHTSESGLQEKTLLLELSKTYGRKRYFLSTQYNRLGYWREGSNFLASSGPILPTLAPETTRTFGPEETIPAGVLIAGTDITECELTLPAHMDIPSSLPFGFSAQKGKLCIHPLQSPCFPVEIHRHRDGRVELFDQEPFIDGASVTPPLAGQLLFRCGDVLFEISNAPEDLHEQNQAQFVFSLRGLFSTLQNELKIGGLHHKTHLPIFDPVPPFAPDQTLLSLTTQSIVMQHTGEALIGLNTLESTSTLYKKLQREWLYDASFVHSAARALHVLDEHIRDERNAVSPVLQEAHNEDKLSFVHTSSELPQLFCTEGDTLDAQSTQLRYHFRSKEDGVPTVDRVPAWLELEPTQKIQIQNPTEASGFQIETQHIDILYIGRPDPKLTEEAAPSGKSTELYISHPYLHKGKRVAKLAIAGYAPRRAARIVRSDGHIYLEMDALRDPQQYHIAVQGEPMRGDIRLPLQTELDFHINHLLLCRISPTSTGLEFQLKGYLLGHQEHPSAPVHIRPSNGKGCIHLKNREALPELVLQPKVCPPHFRSNLQRKERTLGPIQLPNQRTISIVQTSSSTVDPWTLRPEGTDRLLWIQNPEEFVVCASFTSDTKQPDTSPAQHDDSWQEDPEDEGSSFGFGGTTHASGSVDAAAIVQEKAVEQPRQTSPLQYDGDEGSSFGWASSAAPQDDTEEFASPFPTQPSSIAEASTEETPMEETFPAHPSVHIGIFTEDTQPTHHFGYVHSEAVYCSAVQTLDGSWVLQPDPTRLQEDTSPSVTLWKDGEWVALQHTEPIASTSWVRCQNTLFRVDVSESGEKLYLQRKGLWLPSRKSVYIGSDAPQHKVETSYIWTSSLGEERILRTQLSSHNHAEPAETPELSSSDDTIHKNSFSYEVTPIQRGHQLHIQGVPDGELTDLDSTELSSKYGMCILKKTER